MNHKLGILEFNITIADIHTGARFPADCTNRADVAAADPRNVRHVVDVVDVDPLLGAGVVGAVGEVAAGGEADAGPVVEAERG